MTGGGRWLVVWGEPSGAGAYPSRGRYAMTAHHFTELAALLADPTLAAGLAPQEVPVLLAELDAEAARHRTLRTLLVARLRVPRAALSRNEEDSRCGSDQLAGRLLEVPWSAVAD